MAASADPGVSTRSGAPNPSGRESFSRPLRPPDPPVGLAGMLARKTETAKAAAAAWFPTCQEAQDSTGVQSLPRAGGRGGRWAGGGGEVGAEVWGRQLSQLAEKVLGAPWRSVVWGGAVERGGGGAGEGGCAVGYWGVTQRTRLSSGPGKLLASAGCLRVQGGEKPWGRLALPPTRPRETELLGTALGGRELREPAPRGLAVSCLCWTEVWSACFHPILDKRASGIPGEPGVLLGPVRGRGEAHGGFDGAGGRAWGHAQQCSALFRSIVVESPG